MRRFGRLALATFVFSGGLIGACSGDRGSEADTMDLPPVSTKPDDRHTGARGTDTGGTDARGTDARGEGEPQSAVPDPAERSTSETDRRSKSETDRTITQRIRERIREQEGLSLDAQEVTIRARDGVVTLQGPVATSKEKDRLATLTAEESGVKRVDSHLEVGP